MSNRKKDQHYVPQLYLGRFAIDPAVDKDKRRVYVYDKTIREQRIQRVAVVAFERYFNNLPIEILPPEFGPDVQEPEDVLSRVEDQQQRILKRTLERVETGKPWIQTHEERLELAAVVAVTYLRTAAYRKVIREGLQQVSDDVIHAHAIRDIAPHIEGTLPTGDQLRDLLARLTHQTHLHNLPSAGGQAPKFAKFIHDQFAWVIATNDTSVPFCTSDNPFQYVCFGISDGGSEKPAYVTIQADGIVAMLPLSPRFALLMYKRVGFPYANSWEGNVVQCEDDEVAFWNEAQVCGSERFVFCNADCSEFVESVLRTSPEYSTPSLERASRYAPLFARIASELQQDLGGSFEEP